VVDEFLKQACGFPASRFTHFGRLRFAAAYGLLFGVRCEFIVTELVVTSGDVVFGAGCDTRGAGGVVSLGPGAAVVGTWFTPFATASAAAAFAARGTGFVPRVGARDIAGFATTLTGIGSYFARGCGVAWSSGIARVAAGPVVARATVIPAFSLTRCATVVAWAIAAFTLAWCAVIVARTVTVVVTGTVAVVVTGTVAVIVTRAIAVVAFAARSACAIVTRGTAVPVVARSASFSCGFLGPVLARCAVALGVATSPTLGTVALAGFGTRFAPAHDVFPVVVGLFASAG
jgi:hypothetical protein